HADQHHAVADRHDVAAFQGGEAVVQIRIAVPDLEIGAGEGRVEFVDRSGQQRFLAAGGPVHGVERYAAVDPAGGVAGEDRVRQRRQDEAGVAEIFTEHPHDLAAVGTGQVIAGDTADEEF